MLSPPAPFSLLSSSPPSTPTRPTNPFNSLWRQKAGYGPIHTFHTRLETDPDSEQKEARRVEGRGQDTDEDQAKQKRRGRHEAPGKAKERKESRGRGQQRPAGQWESGSLMIPGVGGGHCTRGRWAWTPGLPSVYQCPLRGPSNCPRPLRLHACQESGQALGPSFTVGLSGIPGTHRSPKLLRDTSLCSLLHLCNSPPHG